MSRAPLRKSILRKIAWFGGDRRVVGFCGLCLFCLGWTMVMGFGIVGSYGLALILPAVLFVLVLWAAREMYKADPWMIDIVIRQGKYRKYYAPKPDMGVEHPNVRDFT